MNFQGELSVYSPKSSSSHLAAEQAVNEHKQAIFKAIEKNVEIQQNSGRQERVFGVVTIGNSKNVISTRVSVSDRGERSFSSGGSFDETEHYSPSNGKRISSPPPVRYTRFEPCHISPDRNNLFIQKLSDSERPSSTGLNEKQTSSNLTTKSFDEPTGNKSKPTKYGVVWRAPGVPSKHKRSKSTDFSLLAGGESPSKGNHHNRLESMSSDSLIINRDAGRLISDNRQQLNANQDIDNDSVLKYFQVGVSDKDPNNVSIDSPVNSLPKQNDTKSSSVKRTNNYEMLWLSDAGNDNSAINTVSSNIQEKSPATTPSG